MAYITSYDNPGEFFNTTATPGALAVGTGTITLGTASHSTSKFLTNLTDDQSGLSGGSTAQVVFGITDALYQRFNSIDIANRPEKFQIVRSGFVDEATGELVYNYTTTLRVAPTGLVAVNS